MKKRTKYISLILLIVWSTMIVVILTFGADVSRFIQSKISTYLIQKKANNVAIVTDLEVKIEDTYVVGMTYQLVVQPIPYTEEDLQLTYQSLDETIFKVDEKGKITGIQTDSMQTDGILEITSLRYPHLRKQICLHFEKVYPKNIDLQLINKNVSQSQNIAYKHIPFYINCFFSNDNLPFSQPVYTILYDEEMLEQVNINKYIPKKTGVTTLICRLENGIEKKLEMTIQSIPEENNFANQVQLVKQNGEEFPFEDNQYTVYVGDKNHILLWNDGYPVIANYQIQSNNLTIASVSSMDELVFKTSGHVGITITLENGTSFDFNILVKHHLSLPVIEDVTNDTISLTNEITRRVQYQTNSNFPITFHFDEHYMDVTEGEGYSFYISPKKAGTTFLKVILDDGIDYLEKEYQVVIEKNNLGKHTIIHQVAVFINKFIGHLPLFFIEAILAFWVFLHFRSKHTIINIILFTSIGSFLAFFTELIQYYMPDRNGCIEDALFDILCYFISTGLCCIVYFIFKKRKNKKNQSEEIN